MLNVNADKLWQSYNDTRDKHAKDKLIENYIPLIKHIVNRMNIGLPPYLEYEDLISYGIFGLMQAIERYNPKKGVKFETYAYTRIKGSIIDELRRIDWVPQRIRERGKVLQKAFSELEQKLGRSVNDEDICNYLDITIDELQNIYSEIAALTGIFPFDDLMDFKKIRDSCLQPDIQAEREEVKEILGNAINKLPSQEKLVVTLYYYEDLSFKEVAEVLELSQGRISQLHTKAILRLRGYLSRKRAHF